MGENVRKRYADFVPNTLHSTNCNSFRHTINENPHNAQAIQIKYFKLGNEFLHLSSHEITIWI